MGSGGRMRERSREREKQGGREKGVIGEEQRGKQRNKARAATDHANQVNLFPQALFPLSLSSPILPIQVMLPLPRLSSTCSRLIAHVRLDVMLYEPEPLLIPTFL